ncbi:hypothetical protein Taro_027155 [Colocasia esculenta]|uniref:Uncharacterized protein n=1 Tax=Colocasia esculenta TaxID=4460 RepID=A0A843VTG9_COLES|nr:hypothetical protein [Colocasia esculenta]
MPRLHSRLSARSATVAGRPSCRRRTTTSGLRLRPPSKSWPSPRWRRPPSRGSSTKPRLTGSLSTRPGRSSGKTWSSTARPVTRLGSKFVKTEDDGRLPEITHAKPSKPPSGNVDDEPKTLTWMESVSQAFKWDKCPQETRPAPPTKLLELCLQSFYKSRSTLLDSKVDSTSLPSKLLKNKLPVRSTLLDSKVNSTSLLSKFLKNKLPIRSTLAESKVDTSCHPMN